MLMLRYQLTFTVLVSPIYIHFNSFLSSKNYLLTASNLERHIHLVSSRNHNMQMCHPMHNLETGLLNVIIKFVFVKRPHTVHSVFH